MDKKGCGFSSDASGPLERWVRARRCGVLGLGGGGTVGEQLGTKDLRSKKEDEDSYFFQLF